MILSKKTMISLYYLFLFYLYLLSFLIILVSFIFVLFRDKRKQCFYDIQDKIYNKIIKIRKITLKQWIYAWIGFAAIQALTQFLTIKQPETWQEQLDLELMNDPAFYIGLLLTLLVALFVMEKSQIK